MLSRSKFAARNIKAGSVTEEREMSDRLIETVLVQIASMRKKTTYLPRELVKGRYYEQCQV
jgi:hypothetical protein